MALGPQALRGRWSPSPGDSSDPSTWLPLPCSCPRHREARAVVGTTRHLALPSGSARRAGCQGQSCCRSPQCASATGCGAEGRCRPCRQTPRCCPGPQSCWQAALPAGWAGAGTALRDQEMGHLTTGFGVPCCPSSGAPCSPPCPGPLAEVGTNASSAALGSPSPGACLQWGESIQDGGQVKPRCGDRDIGTYWAGSEVKQTYGGPRPLTKWLPLW